MFTQRNSTIFPRHLHIVSALKMPINNLVIPQIAVYRVGSKHAWSEIFDFRTFPLDANVTWSPKLALFGDLGVVNGRSIPYIVNASLEDKFDAILHLGDIGYDLFSNQGRTGDEFLNKMQPAAARVPYMVLPGNHEYLPAIGDGGKNFNARFSMPGGDANQYTWTLGPIRFVVLNTEVYYLSEGGNPARAHKQIAWLRTVLTQANARGEREKRPWLVVLQHRPVYCSVTMFGRCPGGQTWVSCFILFTRRCFECVETSFWTDPPRHPTSFFSRARGRVHEGRR